MKEQCTSNDTLKFNDFCKVVKLGMILINACVVHGLCGSVSTNQYCCASTSSVCFYPIHILQCKYMYTHDVTIVHVLVLKIEMVS